MKTQHLLEYWKPLKDFEQTHEGSYSGKIRSVSRYTPAKANSIMFRRGRILKPLKLRGGYVQVDLSKGEDKKLRRIHRLIAETWIPNPENKPEVNHKDGNKLNNAVSNLEWNTQLENIHHKCYILRKNPYTEYLKEIDDEPINFNGFVVNNYLHRIILSKLINGETLSYRTFSELPKQYIINYINTMKKKYKANIEKTGRGDNLKYFMNKQKAA